MRERSRSTSFHVFHDRSALSGASNSFSIQAENRFSVARSQAAWIGQTLLAVPCGAGGLLSLTTMSRVMVAHSPVAPSRMSLACHVPAAGLAISANQKYGGPPFRSRVVAAALPSGAIKISSPANGFSAANSTCNGAPFHGDSGDGKTAIAALSSQGEAAARAGDAPSKQTTPNRAIGRACAGASFKVENKPKPLNVRPSPNTIKSYRAAFGAIMANTGSVGSQAGHPPAGFPVTFKEFRRPALRRRRL